MLFFKYKFKFMVKAMQITAKKFKNIKATNMLPLLKNF